MLFCRSLLFLSALIVVEAQVTTSPPTGPPTDAPTLAPADQGTSPPTIAPTSSPTVVATSNPTSQPTGEPTFAPTFEPTSLPTTEPTFQPTIVRTVSPSDMPSDVPSEVPSGFPSSSETEMPSSVPSVTGGQICEADTCRNYQSMASLKAAVASRSKVCMCTGTLECTETSEDTITIKSDQNVEIECVGGGSDCRLECPNAAFIVFGALFLKGNDIMTLTGGVSESRISVEAGGTLRMEKVNVVEYVI